MARNRTSDQEWLQSYPQAELAKRANDWAIAVEAMTRIDVAAYPKERLFRASCHHILAA